MSRRVLGNQFLAPMSQFFDSPEGKTHLITARLGESRRESGYISHEDRAKWDALHRGWHTISEQRL